MQGIVTNVQRFSIHDGPGIRTTVFFKGCNLRCFWCHNPETLSIKQELQVFPDRCIGCGACFAACRQGAHVAADDGGQRAFLRDLCLACGQCASTCYAEALVLVGEWRTVDEVVGEVLRDRPFYDTSGGGVTLSGGDPLMQPEFALAVLERCRQEGLHTAIETAANYGWERLARFLPLTDLMMMDIKLLDSAQHKACTGVPNERILANAQRLGQEAEALIVRTPVVPGVNDNDEAIAQIARFVSGLPRLQYYELLSFHPMATGKYRSLDLDYRARELQSPSAELMEHLAEVARCEGIEVRHT
jgi:pyruvate formate lyase activating enzyme